MEELYQKIVEFVRDSDTKRCDEDRHYKEMVISLTNAMYHMGVCLGKIPAEY